MTKVGNSTVLHSDCTYILIYECICRYVFTERGVKRPDVNLTVAGRIMNDSCFL